MKKPVISPLNGARLITGIFLFFVLSFFPACRSGNAESASSGITVLKLTSRQGISISHNGGRRWESFSRGLPPDCLPVKVYAGARGTLYLATWDSGLFKSEGGAWEQVNTPGFLVPGVPSPEPRYRKISAFAIDPERPSRTAAATKHSVFLSEDGGKNWRELPLSPDLKRHYITSLAFGKGKTSLLIGTSHAGIFSRSGNGFSALSRGIPSVPYSQTLNFYEEAAAIDITGDTARLALNVSGEIFSSRAGEPWKQTATLPGRPEISDLRSLGKSIFAAAGGSVYEINSGSGPRGVTAYNTILSAHGPDQETTGLFLMDNSGALPPLFVKTGHYLDARRRKQQASTASGKRALYANPYAVKRNLQGLIDTMQRCDLNAIVIDMKDDMGTLFFPTRNPTALAIGAKKNLLNLPEVMEKLGKHNIYTIARMVVFKDKYLYRAFNHRYALATRGTGAPWLGTPGEYWLDPHSEFVHTYNIDLAKEVLAAGFDEIQFDYIRFPSDGPTHQIHYRHRTDPRIYKSEVITGFLRSARKSLSAPISVDVYGITAWYRFGNRIGQDFEAISEYADVLCPMVYPSHFGTKFFSAGVSRDRLPHVLVLESGLRAKMLAGRNVVIRHYLQAFNLLSPTWGPGYILTQIEAARMGGSDGYTFWNAGGDYSMVKKALEKK